MFATALHHVEISLGGANVSLNPMWIRFTKCYTHICTIISCKIAVDDNVFPTSTFNPIDKV